MTRATLTWTGLTLIGLIPAFLLSFVVATLPARFGWDAAVRLDLALWLVLFGVLGMAAAVIAARMAFGAWPAVRSTDVGLAAGGLLIAAIEEILLHEWAEASMGYYDAEFIGPTAGLSFALVPVAIGVFGFRIAPVGLSALPRLLTAFTGIAVLAIVLSNLPDLLDGIGRGGAVAVAIGVAGLYAVGAVALALARSR
jgi:hypothetical protein